MITINRNNRISYESAQNEIIIRFEFDEVLVEVVKQYNAAWDKNRRCWHLPVSRIAYILANRLKADYGFIIEATADARLSTHWEMVPYGYAIKGDCLILQGLEVPRISDFLRSSKRATYEAKTDRWLIRPSFEIAKYLIENFSDWLDERCICFLQERLNRSDALEQHSVNERVRYEENDPVPPGIAIALGEGLYRICKRIGIDYRTAESFGPRPFSKVVGVAFKSEDLENFRTALDVHVAEKADASKGAFNRFKKNPNRTKLKIHVDATPDRWAFKVLNGSHETLFLESGRVTVEPPTVNTAEYQALIEALKWLLRHPCREALLLSDSRIIVRQVFGGGIKTDHLKPLRAQVVHLLQQCCEHSPTGLSWQPGRGNKADSASRGRNNIIIVEEDAQQH